jgi:hypothetical protein
MLKPTRQKLLQQKKNGVCYTSFFAVGSFVTDNSELGFNSLNLLWTTNYKKVFLTSRGKEQW